MPFWNLMGVNGPQLVWQSGLEFALMQVSECKNLNETQTTTFSTGGTFTVMSCKIVD